MPEQDTARPPRPTGLIQTLTIVTPLNTLDFPAPANGPERLVALRDSGLMTSVPEHRFDRLTALAAEMFGAPIALISLLDAHAQVSKSAQGLDAREVGRALSICDQVIRAAAPLVVEDARNDARFHHHPLIASSPHIRMYAGFPVWGSGHRVIGTLCVMDTRPRHLSESQRQVLRLLAQITEDEIQRGKALHQAADRALALIYRDDATQLPNLTWLAKEADALPPCRGSRADLLIRTALLSLNSAIVSLDDENKTARAMRHCAEQMRSILPAKALIARGSDDELVALIPNAPEDRRLPALLGEIHDAIEQAQLPGTGGLQMIVRSGACAAEPGGTPFRRLMAQAGLALREVLRPDVHADYAICNDAIRQQLDRRADIHRRLRNAIENGALDAHAQPIIDVRSGALAGAELLCRWTDPELGPISPAEFVPLAEEWGLALPLTQYMFSALFRLRASLCDAGLQTCRLSINVPGFLLREQALIDSVIAQLQAGELDGSQIMLEITEHSFVAADQRLLSHIHRLREQGIQCAVDDFGTGYASFGQLKSMPVDAVKLDRVFVQRIADDPRDAAIVSGMQRMLGDLGLTVIAEGVETPAQLEMLAAFGCPLAQGWLFDRALPAETFVEKARSQLLWPGPPTDLMNRCEGDAG